MVRDEPRFELLLLQRGARGGAPGPWVFPGGKVEPGDRIDGVDAAGHARLAAARETTEEAGLVLDPAALMEIARWVTPAISPKRFDTWFFLTETDGAAPVTVDGAEIVAHRWLPPAAALAAHHERQLRLAPPTFVTVSWLAEFSKAAEALQVLPTRIPPPFHPRIHRVDEGACMLYPGDAGYESGDLDTPGARHRLWALADPWRYERTPASE